MSERLPSYGGQLYEGMMRVTPCHIGYAYLENN
jgi:hypothetical protein